MSSCSINLTPPEINILSVVISEYKLFCSYLTEKSLYHSHIFVKELIDKFQVKLDELYEFTKTKGNSFSYLEIDATVLQYIYEVLLEYESVSESNIEKIKQSGNNLPFIASHPFNQKIYSSIVQKIFDEIAPNKEQS